MNSDKPTVLVLGATGFIGRNLVEYLISNNLAQVTAVDKQLPNCAYLSADEEKLFEQANFVQKNLVNPGRDLQFFFVFFVLRILFSLTFFPPFYSLYLQTTAAIATLWDDGKHYDYVINLAAETKYGHNDEVYKERVKHLSLSCAAEAVKHNIKRFIEVSTAQVYEPTNKPKSESGALDPWTNIAKFKLEVEQGLKDISGLDYVVVRPAIVYGPGDKAGVGKFKFFAGSLGATY